MKRKIKELWWEDKDLHIVTEEEGHQIFKNAKITKQIMPEPQKGVEVKEWTFVGTKIEE